MLTDLTFIHAADLHLDSPFYGISHLPEPIFARIKESTFASVRHMIDAAVREHVDFILLAGDLFDEANRSLKAQLFLKNSLKDSESAEFRYTSSLGITIILAGSGRRLNGLRMSIFFRPLFQKKNRFLKKAGA